MQKRGAMFWTGWVLSILMILFMLMDGVMKLIRPEMVIDINRKLGYADSAIVPIGVVLLICTALYAFPRTAVLGAILLTGYLGGAIATQVRVSSPETNQGFGGEPSNIIFALVLGAIVWAGIYLRDARLRALVPFRSPATGAGTGTENP
jgi:DoxX-like family